MLQYTTNKRGEEGRLEHSQPLHYLNPLNPKSDQHLTSPYSNTAESFTKLMRIKEMITNLRSIDLQMNSLFQYHKKHTKNSMENMDTDVRVSRVKHLHIQWYNTCTLLEIGCLGEVETFNLMLHNIMERWWWWWWYLWCKLTKWMLYDDQIKSLVIMTLCICFELWEKKITNMS